MTMSIVDSVYTFAAGTVFQSQVSLYRDLETANSTIEKLLSPFRNDHESPDI